jgi:type I restriction enzyme S subunit
MNTDKKELPEGWVWKRLGDLFEIKSGKRVHKKDWRNNGVPFYRAREIVKLSQNGFVNNELFISREMYENYKALTGVPKEGDIIISAVGTLGKCYLN